ncbi:hypothetical protein FDZ71_05885 [bacterium]|nr:MAG: hypothetical protein FDZ71_05885 [bacterium]
MDVHMPAAAAVVNIFAPKSSRVIRALLVNAGRDWSEREIAKAADVSSGMAHYVCKSLEEHGYLARGASNRMVLVDPVRMLKRWAAYNQYDNTNKFLDYYTFEREIEGFMRNIAKMKLPYAATVLTGAWLVAPFVRPTDLHFYVPDKGTAEKIAARLGLNPTPRGGNVKFVIPYDEGVFYGRQEVKGVKVVSKVQLYVDLYNYPARGEEAASRLLDMILREWHVSRK